MCIELIYLERYTKSHGIIEGAGQFQNNWDSLVSFIENEKFTITQRRDSTVIDEVLTRRYGVDTTKDIVIVDTLGYVPRSCTMARRLALQIL